MILKKLYLKNFSRIKSALGVDEVTLDFTNNQHLFTFFQGGNGSGKSSLLNQLHPWREPYDGVGILTYDEAVKEVTIDHENGDYLIRHEYGKVSKTFVYKNGELLNSNGNVREAELLINRELGYTPEFLELSRISSSMSSFLEKKSTERKNFVTSLMPSIDFYLKSYDKVRVKINEAVKEQRNFAADLEKLDSFNEEDLDSTTDLIKRLTENINKISNNIAVDRSKLDTHNEELKELEPVSETEIKGYDTRIEELGQGLQVFVEAHGKKSTALARTELDAIKEQNTTNNINRTSLVNKLKETNEAIGKITNSIAQDESFISNLKAIDVKVFAENIDKYNSIIESIDTEDKFYKYVVDKEITSVELYGLENFVQYMTNQRIWLGKHYKELDSLGIIKIQNLETTEKAKLVPILKEIKDLETKINSDSFKYNEFMKSQKGEAKHCDSPTCPYEIEIKQYEKLGVDIEENNRLLNKKNEELEKLQEEIDQITLIRSKADEYITLRKKYDTNTFKIFTSLYDIYSSDDLITDFRDFNSKFTKANENVSLLIVTQRDLDAAQKQLEDSKDKLSLVEKMTADIEKSKAELQKLEDSIIVTNYEIKQAEEKVQEFREKINLYEKFIEAKENLQNVLDIKDKKLEQQTKYNGLSTIINTLTSNITTLEASKKTLEADLSTTNIKLKQLERLKINKEYLEDSIKTTTEKLDTLNPISDVLDPKKGIPVVFQRVYLKQTAFLANKLLRIAYGDKFEISFELTDRDFFIRVTDNEGNVREDAKSLSDGEKSVVGLSLSLALIEQTGNRDKILYLDEADGVLDSNNRRSFINILENQLVLLGIEQCFIISHNDSFKDVAADVILLRDDDVDQSHLETKEAFLENKNIIFDYKDLLK